MTLSGSTLRRETGHRSAKRLIRLAALLLSVPTNSPFPPFCSATPLPEQNARNSCVSQRRKCTEPPMLIPNCGSRKINDREERGGGGGGLHGSLQLESPEMPVSDSGFIVRACLFRSIVNLRDVYRTANQRVRAVRNREVDHLLCGKEVFSLLIRTYVLSLIERSANDKNLSFIERLIQSMRKIERGRGGEGAPSPKDVQVCARNVSKFEQRRGTWPCHLNLNVCQRRLCGDQYRSENRHIHQVPRVCRARRVYVCLVYRA